MIACMIGSVVMYTNRRRVKGACLNLGPFGSGRRCRESWSTDELHFAAPLAGRIVKQNCVPLRFPNRRERHGPRPMQAEVHPAGLFGADQDPFTQREGIDLKLVAVTYG